MPPTSVRPLLAAVAVAVALAGCAQVVDGRPARLGAGGHRAPAVAAGPASRSATVAVAPQITRTPPRIVLGSGGLVAYPDAATAWVTAHPADPRTPALRRALVGRPTALWLTGNESFANLAADVALAKRRNASMVLTIWNIPLRWDGLSTPSQVVLDAYRTWVTKVARTIGSTRAVLVLEPDALWFYDRLPDKAAKAQRLAALNSAITLLRRYAPATRVYLDAGTASGSVTPQRMAVLLDQAGLRHIAGYAVNVSSYAPTGRIMAYAGAIRTALRQRGVTDPRFVVDTGRNGSASWDDTWCNPPAQRLGAVPAVVSSTSGLDLRLWVKAPGTSDGDCGPAGGGAGTVGGQFLPGLAYRMITG